MTSFEKELWEGLDFQVQYFLLYIAGTNETVFELHVLSNKVSTLKSKT